MQHHAHVARTAPPHLRAHHMAVPPPHTQSQPHMPPLNMAHVPPPPTGQQQPQQSNQQKQSQHLSNGPATAGAAAVITGSSNAAASHVRDHHTARLNQQSLQQHQQHPSSMHSSTQLQKLRQQHQHINNNNNNNSTNKNNYHHHQAPQYNNNASNTHGNALPAQAPLQQQQQQPQPKQSAQVPHHTSRHHQQQQQHQLHHQQQPQQQASQQLQHKHTAAPMPPQQSHGHVKHQQPLQHQQTQPQQAVQTTNLVIAKNVLNTHIPPPALPQTQHLQQQQPPPTTLNYYTAGNTQSNSNNVHKPKYNNNNNSVVGGSGGVSSVGSGMPPKTILQNPNRVLKARVHSSSAANNVEVNTVRPSVGVEETNKAIKSGGNNVVSATESVVSEIVVNHVTTAVAESTAKHESPQNVQSTGQADASSIDANKENMISATQKTNTSIEVTSSATTNINNNILSNEDNTVPKNSKEKTPMCLVNELARYNKITHQYRLTNEKGPAHCKRFTVTLKLGEEEYSAEGFKIKKAQHLAAAEAIEKTKYKHPVPKVIRRGTDGEGSSSRANITPTVELNALAMKLGQQTYYLLDPRQVGPNDGMGPPPDAIMAPRFNVPPPPPPHTLPPHAMAGGPMLPQHPPPHVRMMDPAYVRRNGPYATAAPPQPQMHGHPAAGSVMRPRYGAPAQRAYMPKYNQQQRYPLMAPPPMAGGPHNGMLPPPPLPHPQHPHHGAMQHRYGIPAALTKVTLVVGKQKFVGLGRTLQQAKHDAAARALQVLKTQAATQLTEELNSSLDESDNKSPISLVYEIGIQRSLMVHFKVLREDGPAHMKKFVTACVVGTIVTEGEGNGKKISKKRAAEKMLEELKKLPPLTPTKSPIKRIKVKTPSKAAVAADTAAAGGGKPSGGVGDRRKRGSGSIKEKSDADTEGENPITRLIQLQQNRKEKEPIFELIAKNGNENSRRREFIIEVTAHSMVARGTGNSKKLAKRNAAQNLLLAMAEKDNTIVEGKSSALPYAQTAIAAESAITTTIKEQTNTVLQPIVEAATAPVVAAATAVAPEAHIDVPLVSTTAGQVPGILILRHNKKNVTKKKETILSTTTTRLPVVEEMDNKQEELPVAVTSANTLAAPAAVPSNAVNTDSQVAAPASVKPAADTTATPAASDASIAASSATSSAAATNSSSPKSKPAGVHTKDQLLYLAKLLGFEVNFSDFPKGNHSEFLTIVTLSSNPPQICHGMGTSAEESQNDAAQNALKLLSKLGLNNAAN